MQVRKASSSAPAGRWSGVRVSASGGHIGVHRGRGAEVAQDEPAHYAAPQAQILKSTRYSDWCMVNVLGH